MSIHHQIDFSCHAHRVFEALTDAKHFAELTNAPAEINPNSGGTFSCFDGMISGLTIEIIPDTRLVQAWRVADWEPGVYSIVKFDLEAISNAESRLIFAHTGFPEERETHP